MAVLTQQEFLCGRFDSTGIFGFGAVLTFLWPFWPFLVKTATCQNGHEAVLVILGPFWPNKLEAVLTILGPFWPTVWILWPFWPIFKNFWGRFDHFVAVLTLGRFGVWPLWTAPAFVHTYHHRSKGTTLTNLARYVFCCSYHFVSFTRLDRQTWRTLVRSSKVLCQKCRKQPPPANRNKPSINCMHHHLMQLTSNLFNGIIY